MSDNQLREAYILMKQGDKKGAGRLVQEVLREDRNNINAWWLMSHLLEDEDKIVKSLEKVLAINPDHAGARKQLAALRPEYAHLSQASTVDSPENAKSKNQDAYWQKLDSAAKRKQTEAVSPKGLMSTLIQSMGMGLAIRVVFFIIFAIGAGIFTIANFIDDQITLADTSGATPETLAMVFLEAIYHEDIDALYAMSCPEFSSELEGIIANFSDDNLDDLTLDVTNTTTKLFDYTDGELAYVTIHGTTIVEQVGSVFTIDWDENASAVGVDFYGIHFRRVDGLWKVCVEYFIPMVEHRES